METFFTAIPWFAWIAIIGVIGYAITSTIAAVRAGKVNSDQVIAALTENTATITALTAKIDHMDARLAEVESTLKDVP